jgi:hypothetical protein
MFTNLKIFLIDYKKQYRYLKEYVKWKINGKPLPPPHIVKQLAIRKYSRKCSITTLVESGTYLGEMVEAQRRYFQKIVTIELSPALFESAKNKFQECKNVEIVLGDSGVLIRDIVVNLKAPAIFWLDGHYSGGDTAKGKNVTPILNELEAIIQSDKEHIILIDDARLFNGEDEYPTIKNVEEFVKKANYNLTIKDDIIHLTKIPRNNR